MMTVNLHTEKDYLMGYWEGLNLPRRGLVQRGVYTIIKFIMIQLKS